MNKIKWTRVSSSGYEVSTMGDKRFSALVATLEDGRTIEEAYQLDVKGYRKFGNWWKLGKGKPPLDRSVDLWTEYLALWQQWAFENPKMLEDLSLQLVMRDKDTLTDRFAKTEISQAHALATILNERETLIGD